MSELKNKRHELFCLHFCTSLNGAASARNAGFSEKRADDTAYKLLKRDDIKTRIAELRAETIEQLGIDRNYVILRLLELDRLNINDIKDDDESIKPVSQWPEEWQRGVEGIDVIDYFEGRGEDREQVGFIKKIKQPNRTKILELLGKSLGAFTEKVEITSPVQDMTDEEIEDEIAELERRAKKRGAQ